MKFNSDSQSLVLLPKPGQALLTLVYVLGAFASSSGSEFHSLITHGMKKLSFAFISNRLLGNFKVPILSYLIWRMCAQWADHKTGSLN